MLLCIFLSDIPSITPREIFFAVNFWVVASCHICGCRCLTVSIGSRFYNLYANGCMVAKSLFCLIQECPVAFVFFKTRYSAVVATQVLQSSNPMLWVTELAPEPHDVLWSNLSIPYRQLWLRKIATLLAAIVFMFLFLIPVTFVQGLTQLDKLSRTFPFLRGLLKK